ncbi:MAG: hypothetical protein AB7F19_02580 [Candidatus Babeliales bacterium]
MANYYDILLSYIDACLFSRYVHQIGNGEGLQKRREVIKHKKDDFRALIIIAQECCELYYLDIERELKLTEHYFMEFYKENFNPFNGEIFFELIHKYLSFFPYGLRDTHLL